MLLGDDAGWMMVYNEYCSGTERMQSERECGVYGMLHTNSHCRVLCPYDRITTYRVQAIF
jgi:hypothetical protein